MEKSMIFVYIIGVLCFYLFVVLPISLEFRAMKKAEKEDEKIRKEWEEHPEKHHVEKVEYEEHDPFLPWSEWKR